MTELTPPSLFLPALFTIFIWWFTTGVVLLLNGLAKTTFRWSVLISSALALGSLMGLAHTANQTTVAGAYCAFTCALLVWGWHELTFLTGWLTGPRTSAGTPGATGWLRFSQAVEAILWHELAIIASGLTVMAITWNGANQIGNWTFLVLWLMRTSAKLNLFLGVRNLSEEFLPRHLAYMSSHFRRRPMNLLFPFVMVLASAVLALLVARAVDTTTTVVAATGLTLVATMLAMAIVEHWLLVLPVQSTALWRWALRNRQNPSAQADAGTTERNIDEPLLRAR
jgi:putative photosynthetic complex assembly protein 2